MLVFNDAGAEYIESIFRPPPPLGNFKNEVALLKFNVFKFSSRDIIIVIKKFRIFCSLILAHSLEPILVQLLI